MPDESKSDAWEPRGGPVGSRTLAMVRDQMIDCLAHARGGRTEDLERYLEEVFNRAGADGTAAWAHLYRALTIMRDDSLANGADPQAVQDNITKLHQILEEVDD